MKKGKHKPFYVKKEKYIFQSPLAYFISSYKIPLSVKLRKAVEVSFSSI